MGRELLFKTFNLENTERVPWVPFVGVHGASLIDKSAKDYLHSSDLMVSGLSKSVEQYRPDGIPVIFDLQVEAEAMGCKLRWSDNTPPAVVSHPLSDGAQLTDLHVPSSKDRRIPEIMKAAGILRDKFPDLALYGLVTGPFTLGLHLLGTEIFIKMMEDPGFIHTLMQFTTSVTLRMSEFYMDKGCDVIAVVDPMTSQIDPNSFRAFVSPYVSEIFERIRKNNVFSSFFVCGHAQQNIEEMCKCRPNNISIDENIPLDYMKEYAAKYNISFGGNLMLTMVLLLGTPEEVQKEVNQCIKKGGSKGYILSPGCDLPMFTPPENLESIGNMIHDPYQRDVIHILEDKKDRMELLNMKDYGQNDKVIIDIITLDSESCAPCQYMVEAVKRVIPYFDGIVEWREHPIKKMEGISFMSSLMVKNIPTICIDGKITFVSKIPPRQELIAAKQQRINEKLKLKIKSRKGEIIILGRDPDECKTVSCVVRKALDETGKNMEIIEQTDKNLMASYGIYKTPAIIIAEYKLKSEGVIPEIAIIKEWLKDL